MSKVVWRIASDTLAYQADELSGAGAGVTGGRWNEGGRALVYAAENRSLACLETVVHLTEEALPFNRYLIEITIPDEIWSKAHVMPAASLPMGWDAEPPGQVSVRFGTAWARSGRSAVLVVPSVIVPEESNILINPGHDDGPLMSAIKTRRWLYDSRLSKRNRSFAAPA